MQTNPLAKAIRTAFISNVTNQPLLPPNDEQKRNTLGNILKYKRISRFEQAINRFLSHCGEKPVPVLPYNIDEKNLLTFSLQLSGYIRDAQETFETLSNAQASAPELVELYQAAAQYSVDCTGNIENSKYVFHKNCDYQFWKIHNPDTISHAKFNNYGFIVNPERHNLFLSMPFHIQGEQEILQFWTSEFMGKTLDNKNIFGPEADVYLAHFPIEQPRGEKFALCLKTIRNPENYFTNVDMNFVSKNFSRFLGKGIKIDDQHRIKSGSPHDKETFKRYCGNITIVGYCAGMAHAHRWINAFSHLAEQIYDKQTVKEALQNIFVVSYAFLPIQKDSKYSGMHFMSNYADDHLRREPFINMFNPELYKLCRFEENDNGSYRLTTMEDGRNFIIAMKLPQDFTTKDENGNEIRLKNEENGHHMGFVTKENSAVADNTPLHMFSTALENASLGKRGLQVLLAPQSRLLKSLGHDILNNREQQTSRTQQPQLLLLARLKKYHD